jgi:PhnB protein
MVDPIPTGYHTITPYLCVDGATDAIEFYKDVFGALESVRMPQPDGRVGHAELRFGDSAVMLSDEFPEMGVVGPKTLGGTPTTLYLYVEDADRTFERAVAAGSTVVQPVEDKFYGDRSGQLVDPWGHQWSVSTHIEDVDPEEMQRRAAEEMSD